MNDTERREARYKRRQAERQRRRQARSDALGGLEKVFNYHSMFFYGRKCCNGVRWKQSVQNFELHLFSRTAKHRREILSHKWKPGPPVHFNLRERGKARAIDAPHINDRQVHKTLCNNAMIPLYGPSMIYDNGASQKGKGLDFHQKRLKQHLRQHFARYGRTGAVFLMDFHNFFPSAPHAAIYERHKRLILDTEIRAVADAIVEAVTGGVGMPLGVEPSQLEMVSLPSSLDNYIKCQLRVQGGAHYMDDYYLLFPTREQAEQRAEEVIRRAEAMGLEVNRKKCQVINLDKFFRFCKAKYKLTETGRVVVHGCRDGMKRARRKHKSFAPKVATGEMSIKDVEAVQQSQIAYYEKFNDHGRIMHLRRLVHAIYGGVTHV